MKTNIKKLTLKQIKFLKKKFQSFKFSTDFNLVYESQIPNTGIVLLDGKLNLFRKQRTLSVEGPGLMLGVHELLNNVPLHHGCMVVGKSEIIILQKSDILEAMSDVESKLYAILIEKVES